MVNGQEIMGCESVDMGRFDLGTLLQGQMRILLVTEIIGSESFGMVRFDLWTPPSRSNEDSQA